MLTTSQNGWRAGTRADAEIVPATLADTGIAFPAGLRGGDAGFVLLWVAVQLHRRVEAGKPGWCWGYNYRPIRGTSSRLSNHSSGTAFDWNAPKHPLGKSGTWTPEQLREIRAILAEVDGVVRCGAFYEGRRDDMHFELVGTPTAVARVADRLRGRPATPLGVAKPPAEVAIVGGAGGDGTLRPGAKGSDVLSWQRELWRVGFAVGEFDAVFGPAVEGATLDLQRATGPGTTDDGVVGPQTKDAARLIPTYPKAPGPALPLAGPGGPFGTVFEFQRRLVSRGWTLATDGKYGPRTEDVVRRFQLDALSRGFVIGTADGVGGPATWAALWTAPITR